MTDNNVFANLTFTSEDEKIVTEGAGEFWEYGGLEVRKLQVDFFASGASFKIADKDSPTGHLQRKDKDTGELSDWQRGGIRINNKSKDPLLVLILHLRDKDEQPFKSPQLLWGTKKGDQWFEIRVKDEERENWESVLKALHPRIKLSKFQKREMEQNGQTKILTWSALQAPELWALADQGCRADLVANNVVWYKAQLLRTGGPSWDHATKTNEDGSAVQNHPQYRANFTLFKNEAEMLAAKKEHWDEEEETSLAEKNWTKDLIFPKGYDESGPEEFVDLLAAIKSALIKGTADVTIIDFMELSGFASDEGQTPVDGEAILAAAKKAIL